VGLTRLAHSDRAAKLPVLLERLESQLTLRTSAKLLARTRSMARVDKSKGEVASSFSDGAEKTFWECRFSRLPFVTPMKGK
jgi:hypothetical protein